MSASSAAYITYTVNDKMYTYHFTGVTFIEHNMALNLENTSSQGTDIVNGARNLADQVTLSVVETDVEHTPGWSARMLENMVSLKKKRHLCKVVTSMGTYNKMLLTEITAVQDEENQYGWSGELVFMEYIPEKDGKSDTVKINNNSSVRKNTGSTGTKKVLSPFQQMLSKL